VLPRFLRANRSHARVVGLFAPILALEHDTFKVLGGDRSCPLGEVARAPRKKRFGWI
jgi:hypothetical protein